MVSPGPDSRKPESVPCRLRHTENVGTLHIYIHKWTATQVTDRQTEHSHKHSTNGLILLTSLAEQLVSNTV